MLAIILGLCASACLIISSLSLQRKRILCLSLGINAFNAGQYLLLGQQGALITITMGFLMAATMLASLKWKALGSPVVLSMFLIAYPVAFFTTGSPVENPIQILPLFGTMVATVALFLKNILASKTAFIIASMSWLVFQGSAGAYGSMVGEGITLMGNIVALGMLIAAAKTGTPLNKVPELGTYVMKAVKGWRKTDKTGAPVQSAPALTAV